MHTSACTIDSSIICACQHSIQWQTLAAAAAAAAAAAVTAFTRCLLKAGDADTNNVNA